MVGIEGAATAERVIVDGAVRYGGSECVDCWRFGRADRRDVLCRVGDRISCGWRNVRLSVRGIGSDGWLCIRLGRVLDRAAGECRRGGVCLGGLWRAAFAQHAAEQAV